MSSCFGLSPPYRNISKYLYFLHHFKLREASSKSPLDRHRLIDLHQWQTDSSMLLLRRSHFYFWFHQELFSYPFWSAPLLVRSKAKSHFGISLTDCQQLWQRASPGRLYLNFLLIWVFSWTFKIFRWNPDHPNQFVCFILFPSPKRVSSSDLHQQTDSWAVPKKDVTTSQSPAFSDNAPPRLSLITDRLLWIHRSSTIFASPWLWCF